MTWRNDARCATKEPDSHVAEGFFPYAAEEKLLQAAKAVCAVCPVRAECLNEALTCGYDYGVWGGLSEAERRALRARGTVQGQGVAA